MKKILLTLSFGLMLVIASASTGQGSNLNRKTFESVDSAKEVSLTKESYNSDYFIYILFTDGCFHLGKVDSSGWWEPINDDHINYPGFISVYCPYTSEEMMYFC